LIRWPWPRTKSPSCTPENTLTIMAAFPSLFVNGDYVTALTVKCQHERGLVEKTGPRSVSSAGVGEEAGADQAECPARGQGVGPSSSSVLSAACWPFRHAVAIRSRWKRTVSRHCSYRADRLPLEPAGVVSYAAPDP
jgi:hypothetical protein